MSECVRTCACVRACVRARMIVRLHECVSGFLEVFPYIPPPLFSFPLSHLVK